MTNSITLKELFQTILVTINAADISFAYESLRQNTDGFSWCTVLTDYNIVKEPNDALCYLLADGTKDGALDDAYYSLTELLDDAGLDDATSLLKTIGAR